MRGFWAELVEARRIIRMLRARTRRNGQSFVSIIVWAIRGYVDKLTSPVNVIVQGSRRVSARRDGEEDA